MKIRSQATQDFKVVLVLDEQEAGALHDIVAYGYKNFMEVFREKLGKHYIDKHEKGCQSLFEVVSAEMPGHLSRFKSAREIFTGEKK